MNDKEAQANAMREKQAKAEAKKGRRMSDD